MTWRIVITRASEADFDALSQEVRSAVSDELFAWIDNGPPRSATRLVGAAVLFADPLSCGYTVSYFVEEAERYVAVVRVRRTEPAR